MAAMMMVSIELLLLVPSVGPESVGEGVVEVIVPVAVVGTVTSETPV